MSDKIILDYLIQQNFIPSVLKLQNIAKGNVKLCITDQNSLNIFFSTKRKDKVLRLTGRKDLNTNLNEIENLYIDYGFSLQIYIQNIFQTKKKRFEKKISRFDKVQIHPPLVLPSSMSLASLIFDAR